MWNFSLMVQLLQTMLHFLFYFAYHVCKSSLCWRFKSFVEGHCSDSLEWQGLIIIINIEWGVQRKR